MRVTNKKTDEQTISHQQHSDDYILNIEPLEEAFVQPVNFSRKPTRHLKLSKRIFGYLLLGFLIAVPAGLLVFLLFEAAANAEIMPHGNRTQIPRE
jgi:hypothetical protein